MGVSWNDYILSKSCILLKEISKASFFIASRTLRGVKLQCQFWRAIVKITRVRYIYVSTTIAKWRRARASGVRLLLFFSPPLQARFPIFRNRARIARNVLLQVRVRRSVLYNFVRGEALPAKSLESDIREKGVTALGSSAYNWAKSRARRYSWAYTFD